MQFDNCLTRRPEELLRKEGNRRKENNSNKENSTDEMRI